MSSAQCTSNVLSLMVLSLSAWLVIGCSGDARRTSAPGAPASGTCSDSIRNGREADVDCGGACVRCAFGRSCSSAIDCLSGLCAGGACIAPLTCDDEKKQSPETDIDCGGGLCTPCALTQFCSQHSDCLSEACIFGVCDRPSCGDNIRNQGEEAVDCGGAVCAPCVSGPDGGESTPVHDVGTDTKQAVDITPEVDTYVPPGGDVASNDAGPTVPNTLVYDAKGSNGVACTDSCALELDVGESVEIAVKYLDGSGGAIKQAAINWAVDGAGVKLEALNTLTDTQGRSALLVTAKSEASSVIVRASAAGDANLAELPFSFTVLAGVPPAARIGFSYAGTGNIAAVEIRLFRAEDKTPTCEEVHPDTPNGYTATLVKSNVATGQQASFPQLPGLAEGTTETWIAQAIGPSSAAPSAAGCVSFEATFGETAEVTVPVTDLPVKFAGVYDITTKMDLYTGLTGPAGSSIGFIIQLFDSPGATALEAACTSPSNQTLKAACGWLWDGQKPSGAGVSVATVADDAFYGLIAQFLGSDVAFAGDAIASLFTEFRMGSRLELGFEAQNGSFPEGSVGEEWTTAQYLWKFGKECPPSDDDCGFEVVKLSDIFGANPTAAPVVSNTDAPALIIAKHDVPGFDYGLLVNYLVEEKILPSLFGDGSTPIEDPDGSCDGEVTPEVDTYEEVIGMIIGDECCNLYDDCCEFFAAKPAVKEYEFFSGQNELVCELLIPAAGSFIRKTVGQVGGSLNVGTAGACPAIDLDKDRTVDALGSKASPCTWNLSVEFVGGSSFEPENSFTGLHK